MKKLFLLIVVIFGFCSIGSAQVPLNPLSVNVSALPAAASNAKKVYIAQDGAFAGDCTIGGGGAVTWCRSNGSTWVAVGDGTSVGGTGEVISFNGREGAVLPAPDDYEGSDITQDSTHRFATDAEKTTWNGKQDALGFTPENVANKVTSFGTLNNTLYPSVQAVKTELDGKQAVGNYITGLTGDGTASGPGNVPLTLKNTGTPGTYRSVTFDAQGRETGGTNPTTFAGYAISDTIANFFAAVPGPVPSAHGGTGINNAGTLTNPANTTITGGGTFSLGGFTFTVPATGTAVLTSRTLVAGAGLTGGGDLSADRTFTVGAGNGITVNADDVALTTPGTVTVSSTNSASGNHTHAVTSSSNPGAAASLLSSTSGGRLTLVDLLGTSNIFVRDTSTGFASPGTTVVSPMNGNAIRSTTFFSGLQGWGLNELGDAEFANVTVRGAIRSSVIVYNALLATAGTQAVYPSAAKLKNDVVIPASPTYGTTTVSIDAVDQDGLTHAASQLFAVNDILLLKDGITGYTYFKVTAASDQTTFWRYTAAIMAGTNTVTYRAGLGIADHGVSGKGFIIQTADAANAPYLQMATHAATFTAQNSTGTLVVTPQLRLGNLNGSYGYNADIYGFAAGQHGVASKSWITVDQTNGIRIGNNTTTLGQWDISGNLTLGAVASNQGNAYWNNTTKTLQFRGGLGGTVVQAYVNTTGALMAGNGTVKLDSSGIKVLGSTSFNSERTYAVNDGSIDVLNIGATVSATDLQSLFYTTGTGRNSLIQITSNAPDSNKTSKLSLVAVSASYGTPSFSLVANASGTYGALTHKLIIGQVADTDIPTAMLDVRGSGLFNLGGVNGQGMGILSGGSGNYIYYGIGRTVLESLFGIAAATNQFFTGTVAGDFIINAQSSSQKIFFGAGIVPTLVMTSSGVGIGPVIPVGDTDTVLDIYGASHSGLFFHNSTSGTTSSDGATLQMVGTSLYFYNREAGSIFFGTSNATRIAISPGGGVVVGAPTGGDKGTGTLNAVAVYDDNVLLTDWVFEEHYATSKKDGSRLFLLSDTREVTEREHRLPWMPKKSEFEKERHVGGMVKRLWQGQEQQQLYIFQLEDRITKLEAKGRTNQ